MKNHSFSLARYCIIIASFLISMHIYGQKTITGVVIDGDANEALIGGTVLVKGKSTGTATDINGKYSIVADPSDVLVFTYVGLEKQEVAVADKTVINVTLKSNSLQLQEVVAIGYGTVKKSDLTGSVAVVSAKELTKNPSSSAAQALQGKAPGVLVTQNGQPGGKATIRVRGIGSINLSSEPVYIMDGVRVSDISGIQPQDIESMQVLKDASACAIYGANGSNGVIIITTKRGKSGKPQVNLNTYIGLNLAPKQYDVMNADQYSTFYTAINGAKPEYQQAFREKYYGAGWQEGTNWQNQLFQNGVNQNYNLSVAGGGENSNFNVSFGYSNEEGTIIKNNYERYQIRANSDFKLRKYLKIGENLSASYGTGENPITVATTIWDLNASPLMKVFNSNYVGGFESYQTNYWDDGNGGLTQISQTGQTAYSNTVTNDKPNPLCAPSLGSNKNYGSNVFASIYAQLDITDWLMFKTTPSVEISSGRTKYWLPNFTGNRSLGYATLSESYYENIALHIENQLMFKKSFSNIHNVQATLVQEATKKIVNSINGLENGFDFEQLNTLSNGGTISKTLTGSTADNYRMVSYLGRVIYDYKGKYFATASFRSDGISIFAPAYRRGPLFSSGSFAWKVTEDYLKDVKELDMMKLRLGWGQTGNSNVGNSNSNSFLYQDNITEANSFKPVFGDDQHIASAQYIFAQMGSPTIHWETAESWNGGLDLTMFNSKLQFSAEYYLKNNNDLLVQVPISGIFGRNKGGSMPWYNMAKLRNQGIEISLQWRDHVGDFNYGLISNLTTIKNEVLDMPFSNLTYTYNRTIVGQPISSLFGYVSDGIIQLDESNYTKDANGDWQKQYASSGEWTGNYLGYRHAYQGQSTPPQPGDLKYRDLNGDGNITNLDRTIIGKTIPSFTYSIGFDCSYKSFDFNLFLFGISGNDIYNAQRASLSSMNTQDMGHNKLTDYALNHWTIENASTTHVRVDPANTNMNDQISSFWIEDGSFLRVKDIQIGYTLPEKKCKKLGIASFRIYTNASNLYCFTSYQGRDPEGFSVNNPGSAGVDKGDYPIPRSFTLGLQIGF